MRGKPLRGRSMSSKRRVCGACLVVLAGIWLGGGSVPAEGASTCPNAQFRSGPSERLPDCRAYEQVSPVEKGGQDAVTLQPMLPAQASPCEGAEPCVIAYMDAGAAFAGDPGNEYPNAYLATRGASSWRTTPLSPPTPQAPASSSPKLSYAFSEDLSQSVLRVPLQQLSAGAPAGVYNLYLREPNGAYSLLTTTPPPEPPQAGCGYCFEHEDVPAFAGASSEFSHVIFEANDSLDADAPGGGIEDLYEAVAGRVQLVGVLPDGTIPPDGSTPGGGMSISQGHAHELEHAISQDGSDVLFEAAADGGAPDEQQVGDTELYDRIDGNHTVEISAPAPGAQPDKCETKEGLCDPQPAQFWAASANGSVVYFTSKAALTKESHTGPEPADPGNDLYQYEVGSDGAAGTLTDLTPDAYEKDGAAEVAEANGARVLGVVGASEDGSYVYFVAEGHLAEGASAGHPNLYVWHEAAEGESSVRFIATLAAPEKEEQENIEEMLQGAAFPYHSDVEDWTSWPSESQAYVTPDGRHLAFMSVEPLTGYENIDEAGEAVHEVFEYSAESGRLLCASCDPSGTRPLGSAFIGARLEERASTPFHQPRSLSDDGSRLFFSSPDQLAGVAGGSVKVFEYEDGTIQPISGAEPGGEAVFLDASASGNDVFFATRERLTQTDTDELLDVYDARVGGGLPTPSQPSSCEGIGCQEPLTAAPLLGTPISASFAGAGNLVPPPAQPPVKLTRKQLLSHALAACQRLRDRKRRLACGALAKKRYGPRSKRKRRVATVRRQRP
jgi:hypothetical protein